MSTHVVVIGADLRRATIKVTPGTYLIDVLQEACKKLSISSDKFILKHKQKTVDLTVPFRTSGLVGGAKLELVQRSNTPSAVQIGLQLPQPEAKEVPGGRLIKRLPSDLTLWGVLRQLESGTDASAGRNINITARGVARTSAAGAFGAGQLYYETPVLNIMGRDYTTFADFQKTLAQLGHNSGSVLVRLTFKTTDQTLFEAMEQIGQYFKETSEEKSAPAQSQAGADSAPTTEPKAEEAQPVQVSDTPMTEAPSATQSLAETAPAAAPVSESKDPYEPVGVFLAPSNSTPAAALAPADESDFTPTVAHAKLHQSQLQQSGRNKRLPSDQELAARAADEQARVAAIKSVLVKVRFPDNTSSDWQMDHAATGAVLHAAVRHVMADPTLPFRLVLPGSTRRVVRDEAGPTHALIADYKMHGRVLVNLLWTDDVPPAKRRLPFLKAAIARQGREIEVPELPTYELEETTKPAPSKDDGRGTDKAGDGKGGSKVPKWLKLGKK
ncbi:GLUT4 regulating protein TUG [Cordyceps fumosorosea ARSEF 2679]|uniref:GLUT4 regulating protein TUG n=1 Tax=Cordyceps fumosorosea (strain ARSEF 2679) TaxID=1081104 RepID=A0A162MLY7_CORFA|nr:GLUT4 regulating protein TUG [Cordyceps fumosorosea ARSEF 2679]OAA63940.1 GLUT4 regulating protein TUG [Cordyceps fumosorosea ARSEF 2679]